MKRIFVLTTAIVIALGAIAFAGEKPVAYKAELWRNVQIYDVATLSKDLAAHTRQLVGVKCSLRGKDIHHMKPNWYESSVWQPIPGQSGKFSHLSVMIAKKDLDAFKSIPTDTSGAEITLYGIVEYDIKPNFRYLRLIGRNVSTDAAGNATVTW
jgi:hypothetical protein